MASLTQQAYDLLVKNWHVDGDHALTYLADRLKADSRAGAIKELDWQIECATAELRAYLALRSALVMQDNAALEAIRYKDATDIADWPDRLEARDAI